MTIWNFQSNMNRGELDPLLVGRIDIQSYYNGLAKATNVLTIPQGGVKRRPGTEYLATVEGNDPFDGDGRLENFSFSTEQSYLLCFTNRRMYIFKDGVLQTNINGGGNDYLTTTFDQDDVKSFDYIQSADTIIIAYGRYPKRIRRQSDTEWLLDDLPLTNIPQYDFNDSLSPIPTDAVQLVLFTDAIEGDRYKISLEGLLTDEITFAGDDQTNEQNIRIALQDLINTGSSGISVSTNLTGASYQVTFGGDSAGEYDLLTVTAVFTEKATFKGATTEVQAGTPRSEDVWSDNRGFPTVCTFHEGRLWFGNTSELPSSLWGSNVNDFFNFDSGRTRDDEGVFATLDTDQVNAITALYSNRALQVFTTGAEFYVKSSPITPANIAVVPQSNLGSKKIRPVTIDGVTLYVQRTGKAVNQFVFINEFQSNQSTPVSSLAPHLINNPIKLAIKRGSQSSDANYVYMLGDNGVLTVFNTLASEDVQAFTSWETENNDTFPGVEGVKSVAVVDDELYTLNRRIVEGSDVFYVEKESSQAFTDCSYINNSLNSDTITGLEFLEGRTVDVKADGSYMGSYEVLSGQVVIEREAEVVEVGLPYYPVIKTMPLNIGLQNGPNAASKKRILRAAIRRFESNGVIVNGQRLADKTIGQDQFDAPTPQTDIKRVTLSGWSLEADITITQDTPMPMTILSIGQEVKE